MKPERREIADGLMGFGITAPVTESENNPTGMRWRTGEDGTFRLERWSPDMKPGDFITMDTTWKWIEVPLYVPVEEGK